VPSRRWCNARLDRISVDHARAFAVVSTLVFLQGGKEKAARLSGDDIQRTALKARVEELLGLPVPKPAT
jgi:hypothetical protein